VPSAQAFFLECGDPPGRGTALKARTFPRTSIHSSLARARAPALSLTPAFRPVRPRAQCNKPFKRLPLSGA
jgi:hypothetical protein